MSNIHRVKLSRYCGARGLSSRFRRLKGQQFASTVHPSDRERFQQALDSARAGEHVDGLKIALMDGEQALASFAPGDCGNVKVQLQIQKESR